MDRIRPYWHVMRMAAREDGANPQRLMAALAQTIARTLLVAAIYKVAYDFNDNQPLSYTNTVWTIGLCFAFFINLGMRNMYIPVEREIKDGSVEIGLIKPLDWRLVKFISLLGKNGVEFLIQLPVLAILLWILVGPPSLGHLTPLILVTFATLLVMAVITAGAIFMTVGLIAFWLNDAKSVFRIVDKMALILCGTFVPLALHNQGLYAKLLV